MGLQRKSHELRNVSLTVGAMYPIQRELVLCIRLCGGNR